MAKRMQGRGRQAETVEEVELSADEQRLFERILAAAETEARQLARTLAGKQDHELFGETEFVVRDIVHRIGAKAIEAAADEQQKKGRVRGC